MSITDELLRNNERYAQEFEKGDLPIAPAKGVVVIACLDARLIPTRILGLQEGDAHVIRNAGGVVTDDTIRSLAISQHLLGTTEVVLIHHTGCGMTTFTDEEFARRLEEAAGETPTWSANAFADPHDDVRESMRRIRDNPFIPNKDSIRGFVYDVETGRLHEVEAAAPAT
jgi:carbonic anhydrase